MQIQPDDCFDATIHEVAYPGRGVARHEDVVLFVPGVIEGETVTLRVTRLHSRYAEAELLAILTPSPLRIASACPLAGQCPGCAYLHMRYSAEVDCKRRQLRSLLQRIGGLAEIPEIGVEPSPLELGYRNKVVLHAQRQGDAGVLGYFGSDNRTVLDVAACPLACAEINSGIRALRDSGEVLVPDSGPAMPVTFRHTTHDGLCYWQGRAPRGKHLQEDTELGPLEAPADSFFQVNPAVCNRLIRTVRERIMETGCSRVIDLYAGVGVFAIAAGIAGIPDVTAVDSDPRATASARRNAARLGVPRIKTVARSAAQALADLTRHGADFRDTCLVVDPPRAGMDPESIRLTLAARPEAIVYISCAPDHLARDLKPFTAGGFRVRDIRLLDMFPRTAHFETCVLLENAEKMG